MEVSSLWKKLPSRTGLLSCRKLENHNGEEGERLLSENNFDASTSDYI